MNQHEENLKKIPHTKFEDGDFKTAAACTFDKNKFDCVEVAHRDGVVAVRDTKDPEKPVQKFTVEEWRFFVDGVKNGQFDF